MEIGSMSGMQHGMRMDGMHRPPPPDPEELSSKVMEQQDADGDGLLSAEEFSIDSDTFANIDTDGDNLLSQDELQAGIQAEMDAMKARFESGDFNGLKSSDDPSLMQQLHSMAGGRKGDRAKASQAYGLMQEAMYGSNQDTSSYNVDQMLLDSLNLAV